MKRKHFYKHLCSCLIGLSACLGADAQSIETFSFNNTLTPSVESFSISKFGKFSPSLYTGAMSYNLPLYTYKDNDFSIPISLDYSFSGYKPTQHSGSVGYGWALNCGGIITREVIGLPDDARPGDQDGLGYAIALTIGDVDEEAEIHSGKQFYLQHYVADESDLACVNVFSDRPLYYGGSETTPDIFRFNFLGYSGEFMLTKEGTAKFFSTSHPSGEFSLEYDFTNNYPSETSFSEIRIRTGNGYCYYFGGAHNNLEFSKSSYTGGSPYTITAWKLRKITAPNGNTVEFVYSEFQKDFSVFECYTPEIDADIVKLGLIWGGYSSSQTLQYTNADFYHLLSEIKVNGSRFITFDYESKAASNTTYKENDSGCFKHTLSSSGFQFYNYLADEKKLSVIKIRNINGSLVEEFSLNHRHTGRGSGASRMFLISVKSRQSGTHSFEYEGVYSVSFPKNDTDGTDYWGFWNGKDTSYSLKYYIKNPSANVPLYDLYEQLSDSSIKNANFTFGRRGAMTKIIYPTGGETRIEYEAHDVETVVCGPNQYRANTQSFVPGGVRVSKLTHVSDDVTDSIVYSYNGGILTHMPRYAIRLNYAYSGRIYTPADGATPIEEADIVAIAYTDDCSLSPLREPHVVYTEVTETYPDESSIVNTFYNKDDYNDIKMYLEENASVSGVEYTPKDHYYSYEDRVYYKGDPVFLNQVRTTLLPCTHDYSRIRGKLKSVNEYDCNGMLKRAVEYRYGYSLSPAHTQVMAFNALFDYVKVPYRIYAPLLQTELHSTMYDNGMVQKIINYTYNDADQITQVAETTGDNTKITRYKYYSEQFPEYSGDVLKTAIYSKADITEGLEDENYLNCALVYNYDDLSNPHPSTIDIYMSDNPTVIVSNPFDVPDSYMKRTVTYTYDENTCRLVREDFTGGMYNLYLWDNNWRNVISTTRNAVENTTSFQWRDMIGPTSITYPSMQSQTYLYDSANRLQTVMDSDGNAKVEYRYHFRNE